MPNRLQFEQSPYLLQHRENPVDWRPWGSEAFQTAREEDKPVFLSIGYSTCHWCHVMAHESFEDETVAEAINRDFIPIKVDREERPDVDAVYMAACVAMTGSGGWPLTVLLTPEQEPFWAGTYLPRQALLSLLQQAARLWREDRGSLLTAGHKAAACVLRSLEAVRQAVELLGQLGDLVASGHLRPVAVSALPHLPDGGEQLADLPGQRPGQQAAETQHHHRDAGGEPQ